MNDCCFSKKDCCNSTHSHFWLKSLPPSKSLCPNSIYFIKDGDNIKMYVTSIKSVAYLIGGADENGKYIPLAGTAQGEPLTGDIEVGIVSGEELFIKNTIDGVTRTLYFSEDGFLNLSTYNSQESGSVQSGLGEVVLAAHNTADSYATVLSIRKNEVILESGFNNFRGIEYESNYSANYTNRSLVDKQYVDNAIQGIGENISLEQVRTVNNQVTGNITGNALFSKNDFDFAQIGDIEEAIGTIPVIINTDQLNNTGDNGTNTYITDDVLEIILQAYIELNEKGVINGVATLDSNGKVPLSQINDALLGNVNYQGIYNAATNSPNLTTVRPKGQYFIVGTAGTQFGISFEIGDWIISDGISYSKVDNTDAVSSVAGLTGAITAENLRTVLNNITNVSIQNTSGVEQFKMTDKLLFQGVTFLPLEQKVKIDALAPYTVFVDTVGGSDVTGEIQNQNKPFRTDAAAYAAMPAYDGSEWTLFYIDNAVTRTMSQIPNRDIVIKCLGTGTFDWSSVSTTISLTVGKYLTLDLKKCNIVYTNPTASRFTAIGNNIVTVMCNNISTNTPTLGTTGWFTSGTLSLTCNIFTNTSGGTLFGADGIVNIEELRMGTGSMLDNGTVNSLILNIKKITKLTTGILTIVTGGGTATITLNIREVRGTGILRFKRSSLKTLEINLNNFDFDSTIDLTIIENNNTSFTKITGTSSLTKVLNFLSLDVTPLGSRITFDSFIGRINTGLLNTTNIAYTFNNSTILVSNTFLSGTSILNTTFTGSNTILFDTPGYLFSGVTSPSTFTSTGTLRTNAKSYGINVSAIEKAFTFKEKSKEIVVRDKVDIVNKTLDPTMNYIIDGEILLLPTESIEVPLGGLSLSGYGFDVSSIKALTASSTIFKSPVGGCGNLFLSNISLEASGGASKVFNLTNAGAPTGGADAIELNVVNFNNCDSLGELVNFRQGLWDNIGIFGVKDGITLSGTWSGGFRSDLTIVRNFGTSGVSSVLFKAGTGLLFRSRFWTDVNADFKDAGLLSNFVTSNFNTNNLYQIKGAQITRNGVLDVLENYTDTITAFDTISDWQGNNGIQNSRLVIPSAVNTNEAVNLGQLEEFIPLSGTEVNKPITGLLKFSNETNTYLYGDNMGFEVGYESEESSAYFYVNPSASGFNVNNEFSYGLQIRPDLKEIEVSSDDSGFKGFCGNLEFDKQGDRTAYAQISDVEDYIENNATELVRVSYGTTTNIIKSTQVFTENIGSGTTTINLTSSIPIGSAVFVSDWGNNSSDNTIIIDTGVGGDILKGDGSPISQTMEITSSGSSFTLRKLTENNWMVIGTNQ